jgi:hypothetical protein
LFAYGILKVIYAPHKAFREILENPKYIGPVLIMILFLIANSGFYFVLSSKTYIEQTLPTGEDFDVWTENASLWNATSGTLIQNNYSDYINGTFYGNKSIQFTLINYTKISMQLSNIGPVNCTGSSDYKSLSIRIKILEPEATPENVTIYLFSTTSDFFYSSLTGNFTNSTTNKLWNNLTIPLETTDWSKSSTTANWGNITGLKLEFEWLQPSNMTLLVDGLFFRGVYKLFTQNDAAFILNISTRAVTQFIIRWVILGGLVFLMIKGLGGKSAWKPALILAGFSLITMFIQSAVSLVMFTGLPTLYYPLEFIGGTKGESQAAYNKILEQTWLYSQVYGYFQIIVYAWTIILCAIAVRRLAEFSLVRCLLIASVAYFVSILAESFILAF